MVSPNLSPDSESTTAPFSFDRFEKFAKVAGVVTAGLYVIGFIAANQFLAIWGISDFTSVRSKYIITGAWTLALLLIGALPVVTPLFLIRFVRQNGWRRWLWFSLRLVGSVVLGFVISYLAMYIILFTLLDVNADRAIHFRWMIGEASADGLALYLLHLISRRFLRFRLIYLFVATLLVFACIIGFSYDLAFDVYDQVPEALGGGKSINANLILNKDGVRFCRLVGVDVVGNEETASTSLVIVLYQNESQIIFMGIDEKNAFKGRPVIMDKSLLAGVIPWRDTSKATQ